jgi:hypothetical protein
LASEVLVRASHRLDLWGELSTLQESFAVVGTEAQLRARSQHSDEAWSRAKFTGSSDQAGFMAFSAAGLLLRDEAWFGQRWLPRGQLASYLRASIAGDAARLASLTQARDRSDRDASISPRARDLAGRRLRPGVGVLVRMDPNGPWWRGEVQDAVRQAEVLVGIGGSSTRLVRVRPAEVLVRLDTDGLDRWLRPDRLLRLRYFMTTQPYATAWDPHARRWTHGLWAAGEVGVAMPRDDGGYWPRGQILHFGSEPFNGDREGVAPFLAGRSSLARTYFVPQDRLREIDPAGVREEVDQQDRVLRYVVAHEADLDAGARREEAARSVQSRGGGGRDYGIRDKGTDRESLVYNGLYYSIDVAGDPHNSIGWVVEDDRGVLDTASVAEAAVVPGARDYVVERTRRAISQATARAAEYDYPRGPIRWLQRELDEVVGGRAPDGGQDREVAERRRAERARWAQGSADSPPPTPRSSRPAQGRQR